MTAKRPLELAIHQGDIEIAKILLESGFQINTKDHDDWTPLHCAAMRNNSKMVQLLLDRGADTNMKNNDGRTALTINY